MTSDPDFIEFAQAVSNRLYRSAYLLCGDRHRAEDLVQETFAKVYLRWTRRFGGRIKNPVAYAHTTLTRTFISERRRRSSAEVPSESVDAGAAAEVDADLRHDLLTALRELPVLDRTVVVLRYLEDLTVTETAQPTGLTESAVRSRCSRALPRLRPLIASTTTNQEARR